MVWFIIRDDSRIAPSQWETVLLCNTVSHWLGASLESALIMICARKLRQFMVLIDIHGINRYYLWTVICVKNKRSYHKISNISCTKSQNLSDSCLVLPFSLPNPLMPGIKSRMKMLFEQCRQAMIQLHLSDQQFYCQLKCPYIRGLTVICLRMWPWKSLATSPVTSV